MRKFIYKITHPFVRLYWKWFRPKTSGAKALIINGGNILLTKNINVRLWSLPGGKVDEGETPEQCLLRELKEELGLSITKADFKLGEYVSEKEGKKDTVYVFVVNTPSADFTKDWELEDAKWFDLRNLPKDISPATLRRIREFQEGKRGVEGDW